jgi:hypothetical protein
VKDRKTIAVTALATVICFIVVGVIIHRYRNPAPLGERTVSLAGSEEPVRVTSDMSPEESGRFAGPQYLTARQQHLANREAYLALPTVPAPTDLAAARKAMTPLVTDALSDPQDRAAMSDRRVSKEVADQLVGHLATVFMVASGLDHELYSSSLPPGAVVRVDPESGSLRVTYAEYGLGSFGDDPRQVLRQLYELNRSFRDGENHAKRWAANPEGFRAAAGWVRAGDDLDLFHRRELGSIEDPLERERAYGLWLGSLAQGALVLTHPPTPFATTASESPVLVVHAGMIVHSADDAYPLEATLWFDPQTQGWWTLSVTRRSSIRLGNGPPLAY